MTTISEIWVDRKDLRKSKTVTSDAPELASGQVFAKIEKYGLTSNNVTYAVAGDMIGYWKFYPAEGEWGKVPVWGFATVVESRCESIPVGERLFGFFPMASHVVLNPGKVSPGQMMDATPHRKELPATYNAYQRTAADADFLKGLDDERCVFFGLFATSFLIADYMQESNANGATQVLIGSASSKTGYGLAHVLCNNPNFTQDIVGLTSPGNVDFLKSLGIFDQVVVYGDEGTLDKSKPAAFVDMAGNKALVRTLHDHFGGNLVMNCGVGMTHWDAPDEEGNAPAIESEFFFVPDWIEKRNKDWGPGAAMQKAYLACAQISADVKSQVSMKYSSGEVAAQTAWLDLLDNKVPPSQSLVISI